MYQFLNKLKKNYKSQSLQILTSDIRFGCSFFERIASNFVGKISTKVKKW